MVAGLDSLVIMFAALPSLTAPILGQQYMVYILEAVPARRGWRPIVQCPATGADFGLRLTPALEADGCALPTQPPLACAGPCADPFVNGSFAICANTALAVVPRGNCSFAVKAHNVQRAGATAYQGVIIYNNRGRGGPIRMGDDDQHTGRHVSLPVVMVSYDCAAAMLGKYSFDKGYRVLIRTPPAYDMIKYMIPFLAVVGFCFFVMVVALFIKMIRDRRHLARRRLSRRSLRKLPTKKYKKGDEVETCAICLDDFEEGDKLRILPCKHAYHCKCVDPWLTKNRKVCPVCKRKVTTGGDDSSDSESERAAAAAAPSGNQERTPLLAAPSSLPPIEGYQSTSTRPQAQMLSPPSSPDASPPPSRHAARRNAGTSSTSGTRRRRRRSDRVVPGFTQSGRRALSPAGSSVADEPLVDVSAPPPADNGVGVENAAFDSGEADAPDESAPRVHRKRHPAAAKPLVDTRLQLESDDESEKEPDMAVAKSSGAPPPLANKRRLMRKRRAPARPAAASAPASLPDVSSIGVDDAEDDDDEMETHVRANRQDSIIQMDPDEPTAADHEPRIV